MNRISLAILACLTTTPLLADDTRKIDFTTPIVVDGTPVINDNKCPLPTDKPGPRPCDTPFTLGELAYIALERPVQNQTWADGLKRDDLARGIRNAKDWPLLKDQSDMIEAAMGPLYAPPILGAAAAILDPQK